MNEVKGGGVIGCITLDATYAKCVHSVSTKLRNISSDSTVIYRMILRRYLSPTESAEPTDTLNNVANRNEV
jgi:hypothetical protein